MTNTNEFLRCERCYTRRFLSASGLAAHKRAHDRSDGKLVRELADRVACAVRGYDRIDDLAMAVSYQTAEALRASEFYGLPASCAADAERVAIDAIRRNPVTEAAAAAVRA